MMTIKSLLPVLIVFALVGVGIIAVAPQGYDIPALWIANGLLFGITIFAQYQMSRAPKDKPQAFVTSVYSVTLLRLMLSMIGIGLYLYLNKNAIHRPSVFFMVGIYVVYTAFESIVSSRKLKGKK